ncbi:hypothetical protein Taro_011694 [Colocasia esculenta]|uniref:Major facilitator superfamily (MFS) profile domain-containing protein n=3 Tax=Magnoliopsida TaxID=3398 RepID=A0A843UAU9_COLES|nr:hypothetical protein [Colocasia esculenta]
MSQLNFFGPARKRIGPGLGFVRPGPLLQRQIRNSINRRRSTSPPCAGGGFFSTLFPARRAAPPSIAAPLLLPNSAGAFPRKVLTRAQGTGDRSSAADTDEEAFSWSSIILPFLFPALGGLLFGYDIGATSGAAISLRSAELSGTTWFNLSAVQLGLVVSGSLYGALAGSLIVYPIADFLGRRRELIIAAVLYFFGGLVTGFAPNLNVLIIGRLLYGIGIGLAMHGAPLYIAEMSPSQIRGTLISLKELFIVLGILLGFLVGSVQIDAVGGWRYMYGLSAPLAALMGAGMLSLPPSPRWLLLRAVQGKGSLEEYKQKAINALGKLRGRPAGDRLSERQIEDTLISLKSAYDEQEQEGSFLEVFEGASLKAFIIGGGLVLFQQITGQPSVLYYAAAILQSAGFSAAADATRVSVVIGVFKLLMTGIAVLKVDDLGRRPLLIGGVGGIVVSLFLLAAYYKVLSDFPVVAVAALLLYVGSYQEHPLHAWVNASTSVQPEFDPHDRAWAEGELDDVPLLPEFETPPAPKRQKKTVGARGRSTKHGISIADLDTIEEDIDDETPEPSDNVSFGPISWLMVSEIFPLRTRGRGISLAVLTNFGSNALVTFAFSPLKELLGPADLFILFASIALVSLLFVFFYVPETKGLSLEEIEAKILNPPATLRGNRRRQTELIRAETMDLDCATWRPAPSPVCGRCGVRKLIHRVLSFLPSPQTRAQQQKITEVRASELSRSPTAPSNLFLFIAPPSPHGLWLGLLQRTEASESTSVTGSIHNPTLRPPSARWPPPSPPSGSSTECRLRGSGSGAPLQSSAFLGATLKKVKPSHGGRISTGTFKVLAADLDEGKQTSGDRWGGLSTDISDDQQDITRGKGLGGLYIAPAFMDKLVVHITKNFMSLPNIKVPLILGIWGGKGQGKSFQCELVFAKMGINPIMMSAGELESGNAGEPAKLIRQRYREAADIIKKGKMCCLFINDLDAGAGRLGGTTQYTVNNQMVNATLMNIADNPTNVQLPGMYNKQENPRVPIIVTGNDFSTLYAPLIRDGRMEKFYWAPTRDDRIGVCTGIFRSDNVPREEVVKLVDTFPGQSIDFFGALRARVYDDEVRKWIAEIGVDNVGRRLVNSLDGPPTFEQPKMSLEKLLEYGNMLVQEQENVKRVQLADKYLSEAALGDANQDAMKTGTFYGKAAQQVNIPVPEGCTDRGATNFDPTARSDDGSCVYNL